MGDPAGIGPEVLAKGLASGKIHKLCRPVVIGSFPVLEYTIRRLKLPLHLCRVEGHDITTPNSRTVAVSDPLDHPLPRFPMGRVGKVTGAASVQFIKKAVHLTGVGCVDGMVTGPINKEAIHLAGYRYPGHTELLADLTGSQQVGMMIVGGPLKIMFVTTHVSLKRVPATLSAKGIEKAIRLAHMGLREYFGISKPRIGVAALNPHAGDGGLFGDEEDRYIVPATRRARAAGMRVSPPVPADTLFVYAQQGRYDGVVAMYHDQGLIPLKLIAFGKCVNLTVGLPILRTSVDHGTAFDIAGMGKADPGSLIEAVALAAQIVKRRSVK